MMNITERDELLSMYSDVHKDAYGFRPRDWERVTLLTDEELQSEVDYLWKRAEEKSEREDRYEAEALAEWQDRVSSRARSLRVDIPTVVRWEIQAEGDYCDLEHYLWIQGVGCGRHMTAAKEWLKLNGMEM